MYIVVFFENHVAKQCFSSFGGKLADGNPQKCVVGWTTTKIWCWKPFGGDNPQNCCFRFTYWTNMFFWIHCHSLFSILFRNYPPKNPGAYASCCESRPTKWRTPKKIRPTERLIAARHQRHEPPFRVTFNFMAKNYWKIWGNPPGRRKIIDIMSDINFFCLSRLRRPTLGWKPAGFFVGMGWPSHFDIRVMCWNETIQSWYN